MKQVTINIYDFKELDKNIQERLIEDEAERQADIYYETLLNNDMQDYACKLLRDTFKDSLFLDVCYDLSCGQGSGAMIEFDINIEALNNKYKILTKKEIEKIEETGFTTISVKHWGNYCHALSFDIDYQDYTFYIDNFDKTQEKLNKMIEKFKEDIIDMNEQLTKKGYEYMDFVSDRETLIDILEENKYLKNGTVYSEEMF